MGIFKSVYLIWKNIKIDKDNKEKLKIWRNSMLSTTGRVGIQIGNNMLARTKQVVYADYRTAYI